MATLQRKHFSVIFVATIFLVLCYFNLGHKHYRIVNYIGQPIGNKELKNPIECYKVQANCIEELENVEHMSKSRRIFFLETSCDSYRFGRIVIGSRQACSVESAAKLNPNYRVYLLYASPGQIVVDNSTSFKILEALLQYDNIDIRHVNFNAMSQASPVERLVESGKLEGSMYHIHHASDVFRYLVLWKYGGIYADLDVITMKSFDILPANFGAYEWAGETSEGLLGFETDEFGRNFTESCLQEISRTFDGNQWSYNGPQVIGRVMKKICPNMEYMPNSTTKCGGFILYPPHTFYPIYYTSWRTFFAKNKTDEIFRSIENDSIAVHFWNKLSKEERVPFGTRTPLTLLAEKYCPKVYAECRDYF